MAGIKACSLLYIMNRTKTITKKKLKQKLSPHCCCFLVLLCVCNQIVYV